MEPPAPVTRTRLAGREHSHLVEVGLNRLAPKQVLDFDVPERANRDPPGEDVVHPGHGAGHGPGFTGGPHDLPDHLARGAGHGDDDLLDIVLAYQCRDIGERPDDRKVPEAVAMLGAVVIDEGNRIEPDMGMAHQLLHDHFARRPGPHDDGPAPS